MVKIPSACKNPLLWAALSAAILFYCGLIQLPERHSFCAPFFQDDISSVSGEAFSSPVKFGKDYYILSFNADFVENHQGARASACGRLKVCLPREIVEALYPGKLYCQKGGENPLIEKGLNFTAHGDLKKGIFFAKSISNCRWEEKSISGRLKKIRALCRLQFKRLMFSWGAAGGLLLALLSGSREYTDPSLAQNFKLAGLAHILALSGMHLSLFSALALILGKKIATRNLADGIQVMAVFFFVAFAGLSPSLLRALLCSMIMFASSFLRLKRPKELSVLCAAFLIQMMIAPDQLVEASFLLSYGALAGLLILGPEFRKIWSARLFPKISDSLAASAGAQLFTAPICIGLFGQVMPVGIISSLFVSPLVTLFLTLGLAAIFLSLIMPFFAGFFGGIIQILYKVIQFFVDIFALFPPLTFS